MSQFDEPSNALGNIRSILQTMLSRLNKISTSNGKLRSDGAGTFQVGVPKIHSHLGTGEGGSLLGGNVLNFVTVTRGAPGVSDDDVGGYQAGSQWIDQRTNAHYICMNPATGAAIWKVTTTIDAVTDSMPIARRRTDWELFEEEEWNYAS